MWTPHLARGYHAPAPTPPDDIWVLRKARISTDIFGLSPQDAADNTSSTPPRDTSNDNDKSSPRQGGVEGTLGGVVNAINGIPKGYNAARIVGVSRNGAGDTKALEACAIGNASMIVIILLGFTFVIRFRCPAIYQNNVEAGFAPRPLGNRYSSWLTGSYHVTIDDVAEHIGLDGAMLLEFTHLGMKVMACIGIPLMFIMGPLDAYYGGGAAGHDLLSVPTMSNLASGNWLYWVYMVIVWMVVIVVVDFTWRTKHAFVKRRYKWLKDMHLPRATTILVEDIPEKERSNEGLKAYFARMFGEAKVKEAFVVKRLPELERAVNAKAEAEEGIHSNRFQLSQVVDSVKKTFSKNLEEQNLQKNMDDFNRDLEEAEQAIDKQHALMEEVAPTPGGVNTGVGFVTFSDRSACEIARRMIYTGQAREWRVGPPPHPQSVRWDDLKLRPELETFWMVVGYTLLVVLYVAYLPLVLYISVAAGKIKLGWFEPYWEAFAPSAGLTFMVSLLPSFLSCIARNFLSMKDAMLHQHRIQVWDFYFQLTYVIMVTAIGTSIAGFLKHLATDPLDIFKILALTLPNCSHFYITYLLLQMTFQVLNLWRYMNLFRYWMFGRIFEPEVARSLAEPEDQDYCGIGARSTNFVLYFNIGLIFGTVCPMVAWVAFVMFAMLRLTYGYLIPYAETKKSDQGGIFGETQLQHIFVGLIIYCILMIGVLFQSAPSNIPGIVCLPTVFYVGWMFHRFCDDFNWIMLPWEELVQGRELDSLNNVDDNQRYVQPEILAVQVICKCGAYVKAAGAACDKCGAEDSPSRRRQRSVSIYGNASCPKPQFKDLGGSIAEDSENLTGRA